MGEYKFEVILLTRLMNCLEFLNGLQWEPCSVWKAVSQILKKQQKLTCKTEREAKALLERILP